MCFPFFKAQGHEVGASLCEEEGVEPAAPAAARGRRASCELPVDLVAGQRVQGRHAECGRSTASTCPTAGWGSTSGPRTAERYADAIAGAGTVFWNGPMGAFELEPFAAGTRTVAEAIAASAGDRPSSAAATPRRRSRSSGSPTWSTTSRPAAARRSS